MSTYYAAAKFPLRASPDEQWRDLSDLTMVAVELVRIARETGRSWEDIERVTEDLYDAARDEWDTWDEAAS